MIWNDEKCGQVGYAFEGLLYIMGKKRQAKALRQWRWRVLLSEKHRTSDVDRKAKKLYDAFSLGKISEYPIRFGYKESSYQWSVVERFMDCAEQAKATLN